MLGFAPEDIHFCGKTMLSIMLSFDESFKEEKGQCCVQCGKPLSRWGRVDRRFCSQECKNHWHNMHRIRVREKEVKRILRILDKNRDVLANLLKMDKRSANHATLKDLGFNENYFTSYEKVRHRCVYSCLDIRYEVTPKRIKNVRILNEGTDE